MRKVFIDTSAFVALRNASEREHRAARDALRLLQATRASLFTSNFVFAETYTVLLKRVGREPAVAWGRAFRSGSLIELLRVDEDIEEHAWSLLESHTDKRWSYVDATSFSLMEREGSDEAFAFDRDFAQKGFKLIPG